MSGFEENEISKNANGGTELSKRCLDQFLDKEITKEFQIIPSRFRELEQDKIRIYWLHDLADDPEIIKNKEESFRDNFHKFVFVSNWQQNDFFKKLEIIPDGEKYCVIENPIKPLNLVEKSKDKINLIYFSTPQRGLSILIPVFEELVKKYSNIHLNVFSSFKIYGWDSVDDQFKPLYDRIKNHPNMTYHGYVENSELRKYVENSHILAYPSIWEETSCRVLIESMSAGLMCVHPNLAALPETCGGLTSMYQFDADPNRHAKIFYDNLNNSIEQVLKDETQNYLKFVKLYADNKFSLDKIGNMWDYTLRNLLWKYPTADSRMKKTVMFKYKSG